MLCITVVDCGIPQPPLNGFLGDFIGSKEGDIITFQCNINYVPSAVVKSICDDIGLWDPEPMDHLCDFVEGTVVTGGLCIIVAPLGTLSQLA